MSPQTRRSVLRSACALGALGLAGCLDDTTGGQDPDSPAPTATDEATPTCEASTSDGQCDASSPPAPTDAVADPATYPEQPAEFTEDAVVQFVEEFETAYQFNTSLAEYPDYIGRRDQVEVSLERPTVTSLDACYVIDVGGPKTVYLEHFEDGDGSSPTPTPLGHVDYVAVGGTYHVTEHEVLRDDVTYACW